MNYSKYFRFMDYCSDSNCQWRLNAAKQALQMKPQYIYTYVYSIIVIFYTLKLHILTIFPKTCFSGSLHSKYVFYHGV